METSLADIKNFNDESIKALCQLINNVYHDNEDALIDKSNPRTDLNQLKMIMNKKQLLIAKQNHEVIGCVQVSFLNENTSIFAMLVTNPIYQSQGIGKKLVQHAENYAKQNGCTKMHLKLLTPKEWIHEQKEFLKNWYERMGYIRQYDVPFENEKFYVTPCRFTLYSKELIGKH